MGKPKRILIRELSDYIFDYNKAQPPSSEKLSFEITEKNLVLKCVKVDTIFTLLTVDNTISGIEEVFDYLKDGKII